MRMLFLLTAEYASLTEDKKLNVMGIFSEINAPLFPARHPSLFLVASLGAELGEYGDKRELTIKLLDPDGREIVSLGQQIQIPKGGGGRKPTVNAVVNFRDTVFPRPGPYQFVVMVDRDHKGDLPLYVNEIKPPSSPMEQK